MGVGKEMIISQLKGVGFIIACILVALLSAFVYVNFIVDREALIEQCLISDVGIMDPERCK